MVVIVGPLMEGKDDAGFWFCGGTPLTSFLTTGGGRVLTAVNPEELFTAVKPLLTAVNPEDDIGLGWGVGSTGGRIDGWCDGPGAFCSGGLIGIGG